MNAAINIKLLENHLIFDIPFLPYADGALCVYIKKILGVILIFQVQEYSSFKLMKSGQIE